MQTVSEIIANFIRESRSEVQLPPLPGEELIRTATQWEKRLQPIPTDQLERVFERVLENHTKRTPIIPAEILAEWQKILPSYTREQAASQERQACPYSCSVDGWVTVNAQGQIWTGGGIAAGDGPTFAKRCPLHRPQEWVAGEITEAQFLREQQNR